ncbi:MAG: nitroreductase family protein [Iamia sp.]
MDLLEGLATTRAIRRYRPEPIPDDDLGQILWHATRAPSGSNRQPFRFIVLRDGPAAREAKAILGEGFRAAWGTKEASDGYTKGSGVEADSPKARMAATMAHFVDHIEEVPAIVLAAYGRHRAQNPQEGASVYPACQNLLLAAHALGYGGVMTMWHALVEDDLRAAVGLPDDIALAATICLGRPVGHHGPVRRRPVGELVFDDRWDQPAPWVQDPPGTRFTGAGPLRP